MEKPTKKQTVELIINQFKLFVERIRPRLNMGELQALAAFVYFQKSGDTDSIPGDNSFCRIENIGNQCMCGSILGGTSDMNDGLVRCHNCGSS